MGKGVCANQSTPTRFIVSEYLGRLCPLRSTLAHDEYVFVVYNIAEVSKKELGNFIRFVDHHCNPNVTVRTGMYGKRRVVLYISNRETKTGEQLFIDYGPVDFFLLDNRCKCDAQESNHLSSAIQIRFWGSVTAEKLKTSQTAQSAQPTQRPEFWHRLKGKRNKKPKTTRCGSRGTHQICYFANSLGMLEELRIAGTKQGRKQFIAVNTLTRSASICKQ